MHRPDDCSLPTAEVREYFERHVAPYLARREYFAKPHNRQPADLDDLKGAAYLGLCQAIASFEPARLDAHFGSYATDRMRGAMLDWRRQQDHLKRGQREAVQRGEAPETWDEAPLSLNAPRRSSVNPHEDQDPLEARCPAPLPEEIAVARDRGTRLVQAIAGLPIRVGFVLTAYFTEQLTFREIGRRLGVSESRAYQLHSQGLRKLREILDPEDFTCPALA